MAHLKTIRAGRYCRSEFAGFDFTAFGLFFEAAALLSYFRKTPSALVIIALLFGLIPVPGTARASASGLIGVLISQELKPFIEMVEGLEDALPERIVRIFLDTQQRPYSHDARFKPLNTEYYDLLVAADPQALAWLEQNLSGGRQAYGMVLNPERIVAPSDTLCGISLNIPIVEQLIRIKQVFPQVQRLGVLFNPEHNQSWFDRAEAAAGPIELEMVALTVSDSADIGQIFENPEYTVDALLFIPDRTVISQTIIEYVIKNAFLKGLPVIGYNRFFHDAGAALSFVIEPRQVGATLGSLIEVWLTDDVCRAAGPPYRLLLNARVLRNLNIYPVGELPPNVELD